MSKVGQSDILSSLVCQKTNARISDYIHEEKKLFSVRYKEYVHQIHMPIIEHSI